MHWHWHCPARNPALRGPARPCPRKKCCEVLAGAGCGWGCCGCCAAHRWRDVFGAQLRLHVGVVQLRDECVCPGLQGRRKKERQAGWRLDELSTTLCTQTQAGMQAGQSQQTHTMHASRPKGGHLPGGCGTLLRLLHANACLRGVYRHVHVVLAVPLPPLCRAGAGRPSRQAGGGQAQLDRAWSRTAAVDNALSST